MNVVDLHPEDLIDKDGRGELTANERERLDVHLARCATCRFERDARAEFALDLESDEELSVRRLLAIVGEISLTAPPAKANASDDAATGNAGIAIASADITSAGIASAGTLRTGIASEDIASDGPTGSTRSPAPQTTTTRAPSVRPLATRRMTRTALLIAAAALLVGGAATATGTATGARIWTHLASVFVDDAPTTKAPSKVATTPAPAVFASATTIATAAITETDTPMVAAAPPPLTAPVTRLVKHAPEETSESAARLFESANEARRQGDYARALTLHRRLEATHPSSREAHASHATVGRLLLDRGDASGALVSFDAYQRHGAGPLDEAVMVGRATALERLGHADEARAAWAALLARFPETPYAEHAKMRSEGLHAR